MATPPDEWRASAIDAVAPSQRILFDTNLVSYLYERFLRGDVADPWVQFSESLVTGRRFVDEIVRWELRRALAGEDWIEWMDDRFTEDRLAQRVLSRFRQVLDHALQPGTGFGGAADGLLAAHALARDFVLATRNIDDFCNIPGLRLLVPR